MFVDHIHRCYDWAPQEFSDFLVDDACLGHIKRSLLPILSLPSKPVISQIDGSFMFNNGLDNVEKRSAALADLFSTLAGRDDVPQPSGELFAIKHSLKGPTLFTLDRAFIPLLGVLAYGVHVNGFTRDKNNRLFIWVARRSPHLHIDPHLLDHLVAGGHTGCRPPIETVIAEAWEEAGIPRETACQAQPVGILAYKTAMSGGLRNDRILCYDLYLPYDFAPKNQDGEVESFDLLPAEEVIHILETSLSFKFNVAPVLIDFMARHGLFTPNHPDYEATLLALCRQ